MIKRILNYIKEFVMRPGRTEKITLLEGQVAFLSIKILNLERQQAQHFQTINDLVKFQNDIIKVVDYANEFSVNFENPNDLAMYGLPLIDDDDEFMN